jgi:hypothetical protein
MINLKMFLKKRRKSVYNRRYWDKHKDKIKVKRVITTTSKDPEKRKALADLFKTALQDEPTRKRFIEQLEKLQKERSVEQEKEHE